MFLPDGLRPERRRQRSSTLVGSEDTISRYSTLRSRSGTTVAGGSFVEASHGVCFVQDLPQLFIPPKRNISESDSQPSPAPFGLETQRLEGFKKFYEAVRTPAHVRVTAGGRIVPNIKPVAQMDHRSSREDRLSDHVRASIEGNDQGMRAALNAQALHRLNVFHGGGHAQLKDMDMSLHGGMATHVTDGNGSNLSGIVKLSPPTQFDHSKPFTLVNGQVLHSAPAGLQLPPYMPPFAPMVPYGAMPHPAFNVPHVNAGFGLMPGGSGQVQELPQGGPFTAHPALNTPMLPYGIPPPGMALPPFPVLPPPFHPLTLLGQPLPLQNQIQLAEQHIRYLKNQLENNQHQIDVQYTAAQLRAAEHQLFIMQSILHQPQPPDVTVPYDPAFPVWRNSMGITAAPFMQNIYPVGDPATVQNHVKDYPISANTSMAQTVTPKPSVQKLSAAAALAPPFKPRNAIVNNGQHSVLQPRANTTQVRDRNGPQLDLNPTSGSGNPMTGDVNSKRYTSTPVKSRPSSSMSGDANLKQSATTPARQSPARSEQDLTAHLLQVYETSHRSTPLSKSTSPASALSKRTADTARAAGHAAMLPAGERMQEARASYCSPSMSLAAFNKLSRVSLSPEAMGTRSSNISTRTMPTREGFCSPQLLARQTISPQRSNSQTRMADLAVDGNSPQSASVEGAVIPLSQAIIHEKGNSLVAATAGNSGIQPALQDPTVSNQINGLPQRPASRTQLATPDPIVSAHIAALPPRPPAR